MDLQHVYIDSRRRDAIQYPNANSFAVHLLEPVHDIVKAELIYASMNLATTFNNESFLQIDELKSKFCTQEVLSNVTANTFNNLYVVNYRYPITGAFAMLPTSNLLTFNFFENTHFSQIVSFQQPIEQISKLNIQWVDRDNRLLPFGPQGNQMIIRFHTVPKKANMSRASELPSPIELLHNKKEVYMLILLLAIVVILCLKPW